MNRLIALLALALSSSVLAAPGEVKIECTSNGTGGLEKIQFIETDLEGQYQVAQIFRNQAPILATNEAGLFTTVTESSIEQSARQPEGMEIALESIWGNPTTLQIRGVDRMTVLVKDCAVTPIRLQCQRQ